MLWSLRCRLVVVVCDVRACVHVSKRERSPTGIFLWMLAVGCIPGFGEDQRGLQRDVLPSTSGSVAFLFMEPTGFTVKGCFPSHSLQWASPSRPLCEGIHGDPYGRYILGFGAAIFNQPAARMFKTCNT